MNQTQINKKNISECVILSVVTLGIYGIYWQYLLVKNIYSIQRNTNSCAEELLCLIFVPFYSIYWWYTRGEDVKQKLTDQNYNPRSNSIAYLILAIFGLNIISMAIMQGDFNSLISNSGAGQIKIAKEEFDFEIEIEE